ncbi:hypothetical protein N7530_008826 [Penicillium desertorum]|uniref:Uncharacterized protein n=1 Tax=Penicillium desertorum TaxID=1303715 RepID=A0A9W9WPY0_9EURO|nr:hypothetical protein N7530_008826 [Penicillium desertorum]
MFQLLLRGGNTAIAIPTIRYTEQNQSPLTSTPTKRQRKSQKLAEFREQLRRRIEEVPDSLGPSSESSGHIMRVAHARRTHLNWVAIRNLAPGLIAAAVASDELRGASALSLCIDKLKLEGD